MKIMKNKINILFAILIGIGLISSCTPIAPVCTSFDNAKMIKKGDVESSVMYSSYSCERITGFQNFNEVTSWATCNNNYGFKINVGGDNMNCGFHYENMQIPGESKFSINYLSVEPKFSLIQDKSAFSIPIGYYFTKEGGNLFQLTPSFLFTFSDDNYVEFNLSPKFIILCNPSASVNPFLFMGSLSAGFGFSSNIKKWAIRPEIGYTVGIPDVSYGIFHYGCGLTLNFGK
jgi:hypothetical protein